MESFKIENYLKAHDQKQFPEFVNIGKEESMLIRDRIARKLMLSEQSEHSKIVSKIQELGKDIQSINTLNNDFNLFSILSDLSICPKENIFINWYRFDDIDRICIKDLANNFSDIWYQGVDDIDIFDETLLWILSIDHDGYLKILFFSP